MYIKYEKLSSVYSTVNNAGYGIEWNLSSHIAILCITNEYLAHAWGNFESTQLLAMKWCQEVWGIFNF